MAAMQNVNDIKKATNSRGQTQAPAFAAGETQINFVSLGCCEDASFHLVQRSLQHPVSLFSCTSTCTSSATFFDLLLSF